MSQRAGEVAARREITGLNRMTPKGLKELCKRDKLYQTPRLNDVLYLHYQGFQCIECLEEYTELKCLWLECNAISEIQGLEKLSILKCLFLQNNLITKIENLGCCPELDTLNLSSNHIRKIENIGTDILPVLNTLNLASNYLKDAESLADLVQCKTLSVLDLSNNRIDDIVIVKIFEQMPSLKVLVLQGNPVVSRLPQYRKTLILACKELTYLDSRPVFPRDRACAEAWKRDGYEGERKENNRWNRAERRKIRDSVNSAIRLRNRYRAPDQQDSLLGSSDSEDDHNEAAICAEKSRERLALEYGTIDYDGDDMWDEVSQQQSSSENDNQNLRSTDDNENVDLLCNDTKDLDDSVCVNAEESLGKKKTDDLKDFNEKKSESISIEKPKGKTIIIEEANLFELCAKDGIVEEKLDLDDIHAGKAEGIEIQSPNKNQVSSNDTSDELENHIDIQRTCEALQNVAQNNQLDENSTTKDIKNKLIDEMYESFQHNDSGANDTSTFLQDNCTVKDKPLFRLCEEREKEHSVREYSQAGLPSTTKELSNFELECELANDKCAHDLEELGSQMEEDLSEIRQPIGGLSDELIVQTDIETDDEALVLQMDAKSPLLEKKFNERRRLMKEREEANSLQKDTQTISDGDNANDQQDLFYAKILDDSTDNVPKRVFGNGCDIPALHWGQEECKRQLSLSEFKEGPYKENIFTNPITKITNCDADSKMLNEKESKMAADEKALQKLLMDLEEEAEQKYNVHSTNEYENVVETKSTDIASVCTLLVKDVIDELTFNEETPAKKSVNFEIGPIESDEEFSYSEEPKLEKLVPPALEDPARGKSIRECLDAFSDFVTSMADPSQKFMLGRKPTSCVEKIRAAQELLKSKHLAEYNKDSAESLESQIAKITGKQKRRVADSATRCFAQREKYDDTLEVVDNMLMVVKKDTGKLEELPPPPALISDSESEDYDTAEEDGDFYDDLRHPWSTPFTPKPRKSQEHLVIDAIKRNQMESISQGFPDESKENDEFYSVEAMTTFGDIDAEFFEKLDLRNMTGTDHVGSATECMRSYNELKERMKSGTCDPHMTTEESDMLQSIEQSKPCSPKEKEGDDLLKKMVNRMKELEEREHNLQLIPQDTPKELSPVKLSLGEFKIFEQKSQIELAKNETERNPDVELKIDEEENREEIHPIHVDENSDSLKQEIGLHPRYNNTIDDDILSDASTEYESGEEIAMVTPPKLPEAVLKSFYSVEFEADQKMVQEREEATRRNLYCPQNKKNPKIPESTPSHLIENHEEPQDCNEAVGDEWEDRNGRIQDLSLPMQNICEEATADQKNSCVHDEIVANVKAELSELETTNLEQKLPSELGNTENLNSKEEEMEHLSENRQTDSSPENTEVLTNNSPESAKKNPIILNFFEAPKPDTSDGDAIHTDSLKTEQIECNLEVLVDDVVVKEVSVSAHVTFK
ncbi:hypothetical protein KR009_012316 [Drosophila setifemur]|nr:hypothetical protein KR009_012316 [Drosophila setifemur]